MVKSNRIQFLCFRKTDSVRNAQESARFPVVLALVGFLFSQRSTPKSKIREPRVFKGKWAKSDSIGRSSESKSSAPKSPDRPEKDTEWNSVSDCTVRYRIPFCIFLGSVRTFSSTTFRPETGIFRSKVISGGKVFFCKILRKIGNPPRSKIDNLVKVAQKNVPAAFQWAFLAFHLKNLNFLNFLKNGPRNFVPKCSILPKKCNKFM